MSNQATALLGLLAETSLHAGAGSSVNGVDLPIQREGHNGWPCVFGSAVKGSLRDKAENADAKGIDDVLAIFGPEYGNASDNAGAVAVGDARLLLLPVRSLTSSFKWVTCAEAVERLIRDAKRMGLASDFSIEAPRPGNDETALALNGAGSLFLEEYRFELTHDDRLNDCAITIAKLMKREDELKRRLVIVSDDIFSHLTQAAVPVNAHIALESETKTTIDGALWYEETLPPETVLYVPLVANKSRKKNYPLEASQVLEKVTDLFADEQYLQLGGNETVGMGWCSIEVLKRS